MKSLIFNLFSISTWKYIPIQLENKVMRVSWLVREETGANIEILPPRDYLDSKDKSLKKTTKRKK